LDRQFSRISNTSVRSAKSAKSDSSNGSSLEKEIFGSIPNNFDQNANAQEPIETEHCENQKKESGSNSTEDSSEMNSVPSPNSI